MKNLIQTLASGVAVYVVMAACSGGDGAEQLAAVADSGLGSGGAMSVDSGATGSSVGAPAAPEAGLADRLISPVPDAHAQDAAPPDPTQRSGERIKARWLVGADGSRQFVGWYDSELDVECSYVLAEDGQTRCVPVGPSTGSILMLYSDAGCTSQVVGIESVCYSSAPKYAISVEGAVCPVTSGALRLGAEIDPAATPVYDGSPGSCSVANNLDTNDYNFYVATPVPSADFVAAQVVTE